MIHLLHNLSISVNLSDFDIKSNSDIYLMFILFFTLIILLLMIIKNTIYIIIIRC